MDIKRILLAISFTGIFLIVFCFATGMFQSNMEIPSKSQMKEHNLNGINISLPKTWIGAGTMCNFFKNRNIPGASIMVKVFESDINVAPENLTSFFEEDICENLELFESTEYYKNRIVFLYTDDIKGDIEDGRQVYGKLINERKDTERIFYGYYLSSPITYIFGICEKEEDVEVIKDTIDSALKFAYFDNNAEN